MVTFKRMDITIFFTEELNHKQFKGKRKKPKYCKKSQEKEADWVGELKEGM